MTIPALLTAAELRVQARVDDVAEDATLLAFGAAAERRIEALTGQALTRRVEYLRELDWPHDGWELVRYPVNGVSSISYTDPAGAPQALPGTVWVLTPGKVARLRLRQGQEWPETLADSEISIALDVGYPTGACPANLKLACLMLAAHYYDTRGTVTMGAAATEIPETVSALIADFRLLMLA
jgi:uncharacterized phiE125 gp8 family phage protein